MLLIALAFAGAGCGRAATPTTTGSAATPAASGMASGAPAPAASPPTAAAATALCIPSDAGRLAARLQGAIDAEIDWSAPAVPQCLGGTRPSGDGARLLYKGKANGESLLLVIGISGLAKGKPQRNLPVNLTIVREGSSVFYATQGDDKCALDTVQLAPVAGSGTRFRLTGRGYCTAPARALASDGAVLVSRFDVEAIVDLPEATKQ